MKLFEKHDDNRNRKHHPEPGSIRAFCRASLLLVLSGVSLSAWAEGTVSGSNSFFGGNAGISITTGTSNSFFGLNAGFATTSGNSNTFVGRLAGQDNTTGAGNTFVGMDSGNLNTTGSTNAFFGQTTGGTNTTGSFNTFIGAQAAGGNTTESFNTLLGSFSDVAPGITNATAIGADALVEQSNSLVLGSIAGVGLAVDSAKVGIGTTMPAGPLHVVADVSAGAVDLILLENKSGPARLRLNNLNVTNTATADQEWVFNSNGSLRLSAGLDSPEFVLNAAGDLTLQGNVSALSHINTSSRTTKTDFAEIDEQAVLNQLLSLPISQWRYKTETAEEHHIGPVAEDFQRVFALGDGRHISTVDASGVSLAAIKGLHQQVQERNARISELETQLKTQQARLDQLEQQQVELQQLATYLSKLLGPMAKR